MVYPLNTRLKILNGKGICHLLIFFLLFLLVFVSSFLGFEIKQVYARNNISELSKSLVRIYVVTQTPDYSIPWNPGVNRNGSGTGFLIKGNRILTNAHVSGNARFISVEKEGDSRRYVAHVKYIGHDCDLALLEVSDNSFFNGMQPLFFGGIPDLDSTVTVLGYPIGGKRISVTRGVVSRIDYQVYSHSAADSHLTVQIDAAINPGNSGGPVVQDNKVVGVAFQGYSGFVAQSVGYMIPVPVIQRFLEDVSDGSYDKYVDLGIKYFPLLNTAHRQALGLEQGDFGVMVSNVIAAGAAAGILETSDVLLKIDDLPILSNGYVEMNGKKVLLNEVVERKYKGDRVHIKLMRNGKKLEVDIVLNAPWPYFMHARRHDVRPRYVLFGGLVFQPLSNSFITASKIKDTNLLYYYSQFIDKELYLKKPEYVLISKILPDPINAYLNRFTYSIIERINDMEIKTLEDVSQAFKKPSDYYTINFLSHHRPLILERESVIEAHSRILKRYGILKEEYLEDSIVPDGWLKNNPCN